HLGDGDFCTIEYERWFDEPRVNAEKLEGLLGLSWPRRQPDRTAQLPEVIDLGLRHDDTARPEAQEPLVRQFYELARVADHDGAARDRLDDLVAQFGGFERLYRGFQQAFETAAPLAAEHPELKRQRDALDAENARLVVENARLAEEARRTAEAEAAFEGRLAEA